MKYPVSPYEFLLSNGIALAEELDALQENFYKKYPATRDLAVGLGKTKLASVEHFSILSELGCDFIGQEVIDQALGVGMEGIDH